MLSLKMLHHVWVALAMISITVSGYNINSYDQEFGVFIGDLSSSDSDVAGEVFVVNTTTIQIFNFTFHPVQHDLYFWFDFKDVPTRDGIKGQTVEYGITPLGMFPSSQKRIVVHVGEKHRVDDFKSFSIYSFKNDKSFGSVIFPENMKVPKSVALNAELAGKRYKLQSGPIYIIDRRTIRVYGFTFEGNKAPETFFYAGRGAIDTYITGTRVGIRGKDRENVTEIRENYRGGKDVILDLPENYDIFHIDWLAVYCPKYRVNLGSVVVPTDDTLSNLPPYVPPPVKKSGEEFTPSVLRGIQDRRNFTFQLADAEFIKSSKGPYLRSPKYVWYVNSVMTPDLYLLRNVTYTFNVEGGREKAIPEFYNPLYFGDDQQGGFSELSPNEAEKVTVYSPGAVDSNAGPLCIWIHAKAADKTDEHEDMYLDCDGWPADLHTFVFTPNDTTPAVLYYNSATNFHMGGRIFIVDEIPEDMMDAPEITYSREKWHTLALTRQRDEKVNTAKSTVAALFLILVTIILS